MRAYFRDRLSSKAHDVCSAYLSPSWKHTRGQWLIFHLPVSPQGVLPGAGNMDLEHAKQPYGWATSQASTMIFDSALKFYILLQYNTQPPRYCKFTYWWGSHHDARDNQRTTRRIWLSPSTLWVSGQVFRLASWQTLLYPESSQWPHIKIFKIELYHFLHYLSSLSSTLLLTLPLLHSHWWTPFFWLLLLHMYACMVK